MASIAENTLEAAREAAREHAWVRAYELFAEAGD